MNSRASIQFLCNLFLFLFVCKVANVQATPSLGGTNIGQGFPGAVKIDKEYFDELDLEVTFYIDRVNEVVTELDTEFSESFQAQRDEGFDDERLSEDTIEYARELIEELEALCEHSSDAVADVTEDASEAFYDKAGGEVTYAPEVARALTLYFQDKVKNALGPSQVAINNLHKDLVNAINRALPISPDLAAPMQQADTLLDRDMMLPIDYVCDILPPSLTVP